MSSNYKKSGVGTILTVLVLVGIIAAGIYIYVAPDFEKAPPQIKSQSDLIWNKKEPLQISLHDNFGLKSFQLILSDGAKSIQIGKAEFPSGVKDQALLVKYPKSKVLDPKAKRLTLTIKVSDQSKWNFLSGNSAQKSINITMDTRPPVVNVVANSYSITQGGAALVVFQAQDENLDSVYVEAGGNRFKGQPYKQKGYYATLIAWPFNEENFEASVVAQDRAGNKGTAKASFYIIKHSYQTSWIEAKDSFIDGKISDLIAADEELGEIDKRLDKLKAVNEMMRLKNEELIDTFSKNVSDEILQGWKIEAFYPLRNGQKVASFGDERHYYYGDKENEVSHSYHVGYDLASTKMAEIKTSNPGKVVFAAYNGIYGNMPMIDHGFGLYSLYGHCSGITVQEGDEVKAGDTIAKTGVTGLALGDHLHFGILVQGVEVRPVEWFDGSWIKKNIDDVFAEADKIILSK